jgi:hypothetical protein
MVNSRNGAPSEPSVMRRPSAPVEKSPLTGFTPECMPMTEEISTPSPTWRSSSGCDRVPGASDRARQPTPGVDLNPPRTALPVEARPAQRPL